MKIGTKPEANQPGKRLKPKISETASERRLRQALDRIAELEQRLATLEQVIRIAADGSVSITAAANLAINANQAVINAASVKAANVIQCDTLIANNVVASTYTPGAGNIW
ncbi:hypothetical protein [Methylomonas koyamae]|uniref:hypothetical protein n=1 Tax=Methylomonas koyamae TaxID=702114 RepID=UPI0006D135AF|nr:hypothetical protein [Methylomonas koyamae]BBL59313.1 hypothetical protein MKFW12EY_29260 [Methylomonas koyamae]